jgi:hypothetical protein
MKNDNRRLAIRELVRLQAGTASGSPDYRSVSLSLDTYARGELVGEVHNLYAEIKACKGVASNQMKDNVDVLAREALIREISQLYSELQQCKKG